MSVQKSCFTVHGKKKQPLCDLVGDNVLRKYVIDPSRREKMQSNLRILGISHVSVFPDLDGLAKDLADRF
jgi:hypothetical protein